jgi:hypothetical protein
MTKSVSFSLSAQGLANIQGREDINDFGFIVGRAHYHCSWFVAEFLSARIAQQHSVGSTIREFVVHAKDPGGEFAQFLSLGRGGSISITARNRHFYASLGSELLNDELSNICHPDNASELTCGNVAERFALCERSDSDCSREIEFIAAHFHELDIFQLRAIEEMTLENWSRVLSSPRLKVVSQDWLYDVVWSLAQSNRSHFVLFENVEFEFVSCETAVRFANICGGYIDLLNPAVWRTIARRLIYPVAPLRWNPRVAYADRRIVPVGNPSLDGVISYLTAKVGGNVHDKGAISVTASSASSPAKIVVDLQNRASYFQSKNEPNSWICYDFKEMKIAPTCYSLVSAPYAANWANHPKSWCLEVSRDGREWVEAHRVTDNGALKGPNQIATLEATTAVTGRFVRLRQTAKTHCNQDYLLVAALEIFGVLREPSSSIS